MVLVYFPEYSSYSVPFRKGYLHVKRASERFKKKKKSGSIHYCNLYIKLVFMKGTQNRKKEGTV